jgi:hypothetical protein
VGIFLLQKPKSAPPKSKNITLLKAHLLGLLLDNHSFSRQQEWLIHKEGVLIDMNTPGADTTRETKDPLFSKWQIGRSTA